jgi:hypothetical protein
MLGLFSQSRDILTRVSFHPLNIRVPVGLLTLYLYENLLLVNTVEKVGILRNHNGRYPTVPVYFEFSFKVGNLGKVNFKRRVRAANGLEVLKTTVSQIVSYVKFPALSPGGGGVGGGLSPQQIFRLFAFLVTLKLSFALILPPFFPCLGLAFPHL